MRDIRFWDLARSEFPDDVVQCDECCALVLSVNTREHADWHEEIRKGDSNPEPEIDQEFEEELPDWASKVEVTFGASLKQLREARGLSQAGLARAMTRLGFKMHQSTIAKMERPSGSERRPIRLSEALTLAVLFDKPISAMTPEPPPRACHVYEEQAGGAR